MQKITKVKNVLKFINPADTFHPWDTALPLGNGFVGALVQGGARYERIMFSSIESLWKGEVGVLPDVSDKLKEVRKLVDAKNQILSGKTFEKLLQQKKYEPAKACPFPIADLIIKQTLGNKPVGNYQRLINMENGECSVCFLDNGTKIERSMFVSMFDNKIVYEIAKSGSNNLNVELYFCEHDLRTLNFNEQKCHGFKNSKFEIENNLMHFYVEDNGVSSGVVARIIVDNKASINVREEDFPKMEISNAERILIIAEVYNNKISSKAYDFLKANLMSLKNISYEKLYKDHIIEYQKLWNKSDFSVSDEKEDCIENLILNYKNGGSLIYEKLFKLSRYLMITGCPSGQYPMLTTGLWSYHYNNNNAMPDFACVVPALYEASLNLNMPNKLLGLIDYLEKYQDDFKKNAVRLYKSKGYMIPNSLNFDAGIPNSIEAENLSTVVSGAVIGNLIYQYFLRTKDLKFLKTRAIPFMKQLVDFYMHYFYYNEKNELCSCPSFSPFGVSKYFENKKVGVYDSASCDFVAVKHLVSNVIEACSNYSVALPEMVEYQNFLNQLPSQKFENGVPLEYRTETNSDKSGGFLHMYPVFGSEEVNLLSNHTLVSVYLNAVLQKIGNGVFYQNSLSLGRYACMASILGQGSASINILRFMITNYMSKNLMFMQYDTNNLNAVVESENYFNVSANQLFASAITKMLVNENNEYIILFGAKPTEWNLGKISGVVTTKNVVVDIEWDDKKGVAVVKAKAFKNAKINIKLPSNIKKIKNFCFDPDEYTLKDLEIPSGKTVVLEMKY